MSKHETIQAQSGLQYGRLVDMWRVSHEAAAFWVCNVEETHIGRGRYETTARPALLDGHMMTDTLEPFDRHEAYVLMMIGWNPHHATYN